VNWLVADYGNYRESGDSGLELMFHNDTRESLQSVLGIQCTRNISTSRAVVIPQFDIYWKHEFADKSRQVNVSFVDDTRSKQFSYDTQAADRDYMEVGAGVAFVFINGTQSFIRAQTTLGQQHVNSASIMLGFNWEL